MEKVKYDAIIIGAGLSGLTAAAAAVKQGKKVLILLKGAGALVFAGGNIDILGYDNDAKPLHNSLAGLDKMPNDHPYSKIGITKIKEAVDFFVTLAQEEGYHYLGGLEQTVWLPTAAGTLKPTCLIPKTMNPQMFYQADQVVVAGFTGLKDFYPEVVIKGLSAIPGCQKKYKKIIIDPGFDYGRDVTAIDIARWLETDEGRISCSEQIRTLCKPGDTLLLPPVLGIRPTYFVYTYLESTTHCNLIELASLPPAVTGLRLHTMLTNYLKKNNITFIEQAVVSKAVVANKRCLAVTTVNSGHERSYYADSFVLATGGILGGGLTAQSSGMFEPIFKLPISTPYNVEEWGNRQLFSKMPQPFAKYGLEVDETLRPINIDSEVILENVYVAGRNLAGYDYCFEKSGNGVALVSGYQAGMLV